MIISTRLALIYALVSSFATLANIATQALSIFLYNGSYSVEISVFIGTAMGFPIKYALEKKHVFYFKADNLAHDTRLFILYGFLGVFTTAIFWGIEFSFQRLFETDIMRYLGGAIGLTIGSFIKYHLDKRFVFRKVLP